MDQIVQYVSQQTGQSPDMVRPVVEAVINYMKDKLPGPLQGMLDQFVGGGQAAGVGNPLSGFPGQ